jgi:hypothetical protein
MLLEVLTLSGVAEAEEFNRRHFVEKVPPVYMTALDGIMGLFSLLTAKRIDPEMRAPGALLMQAQKAFAHAALCIMRCEPTEAMMFVRNGAEAALYAKRMVAPTTPAERLRLANVWMERSKSKETLKAFNKVFDEPANYSGMGAEADKLRSLRGMTSNYGSHPGFSALAPSLSESAGDALKMNYFVSENIDVYAVSVLDSFRSVLAVFEGVYQSLITGDAGYFAFRKPVDEALDALRAGLVSRHPSVTFTRTPHRGESD